MAIDLSAELDFNTFINPYIKFVRAEIFYNVYWNKQVTQPRAFIH